MHICTVVNISTWLIMLLRGILVKTHGINYRRRILILKVRRSLLLNYPCHLLGVTQTGVARPLRFPANEANTLPP